MTEKTLTTENIKPALDALRGELAPWPVVAKKQDRLNTAQLNAANSGITSSLVAQIIANTAAIRALESAITGTGLRALVVASLPAVGTTGILYIVPVTTYDPDTDADVVNYSNEYIWIPVEDGQASEGHYEQVGQTGIVINNGQLTITVNGTSVGTFTANQSGDTTAAITVPTNADYVDRTTDQTVAGVKTFSDGIEGNVTGTAAKAIADEDGTSIKTGYVNVAGNQTVTGDKSFTGSNTFNNILPNATNSYSLGTSTNQWKSVYSQTYYYNGTAWGLDQANVWSKLQTFKGEYLGREYTNNYCTCFGICGNNDTLSKSGMFFTKYRPNKTQGSLGSSDIVQCGVDVLENEVNTTNVFDIKVSGYDSNTGKFTKTEVISTLTDANLGTSTNKWKTINGYEPSMLGEVLIDNAVTIDTTNWVLDGSAWNTLNTSIMSGWVYLAVSDCDADSFILFRRGSNKAKNPTICFHPQHSNSGIYYLYGLFMVPKNTACIVSIKTGTSGVLSQALLYPCFGNV